MIGGWPYHQIRRGREQVGFRREELKHIDDWDTLKHISEIPSRQCRLSRVRIHAQLPPALSLRRRRFQRIKYGHLHLDEPS